MRKRIFFIIAIIIIILVIFGLGKQIQKALTATNRLDSATNQLVKLQEENASLQKQLSEVKNPDFIEQQARNKLNFSRPNETIVIIPQDQIEKVLGLSKKMPEIKLPNWQAWLKLILH